MDCGDCHVAPGTAHVDGCSVARCTKCGFQRIGCTHEGRNVGWGQVWTGEWPGREECREFGWLLPDSEPDLNKLASFAHQGWLEWNGERWIMKPALRKLMTGGHA